MKICAVDFETTNLNTIMGIMLCGSFQEIVPPGYYKNHRNVGPKPYTFSLDRTPDKKYDANPDKELCVALRDELEKYNLIITWNGKMFDIPFLNARLLWHGERRVRLQWHADMMYQARGTQNRIGGSKLITVQQYLGIPEEDGKTKLDWDVWKAASLGDPKAMAQVIHHCEMDVEVLAKVYWKLLPGLSQLERSR